ncbi:glyceraldehyde-3-phosphate dehydrogenase [Platysternon megacephalum]|uniref:Glyceraldehyde-3-phosphate dehydrogenase n=1 Tax=Platysternon megacephalum TaxID=55544 RepID=A0A4D9DD09_9SAUR|nr:glyceraldehyde-3-phosphate dehydrogenase [Platysternon megacephalum]
MLAGCRPPGGIEFAGFLYRCNSPWDGFFHYYMPGTWVELGNSGTHWLCLSGIYKAPIVVFTSGTPIVFSPVENVFKTPAPSLQSCCRLNSLWRFTYNTASKETCERNHSQCSQHAFCTDYATGFCCHCQAKFYGNGRHCLPEGAAHRLNGKVSGTLLVGDTPVRFSAVDLHAYIVGNDGRAYTAISHIPQPAARALMPLTPIGGLFGWLFALEKPGYENGFSVTGKWNASRLSTQCKQGVGWGPLTPQGSLSR